MPLPSVSFPQFLIGCLFHGFEFCNWDQLHRPSIEECVATLQIGHGATLCMGQSGRTHSHKSAVNSTAKSFSPSFKPLKAVLRIGFNLGNNHGMFLRSGQLAKLLLNHLQGGRLLQGIDLEVCPAGIRQDMLTNQVTMVMTILPILIILITSYHGQTQHY